MDQNNTTPARGTQRDAPARSRRRSPKHGAAVQSEAQDHIGRQLRAIYDDLLSQPVPDRFLELLQQLDDTGKPKAKTDAKDAAQPAHPQGPPAKGSS